ncbi:unnamed protein product [Effrenium voratum]|uniref:Uncharacterized protein n=1 Tax=Effrenium voratum TaxID=2562239 RepID=A0AA36JR07_9DINO|nr:unnamed protein product [Effrenium voratum]CAJ1410174.1 unnamed protein product [Effrenium voratum]
MLAHGQAAGALGARRCSCAGGASQATSVVWRCEEPEPLSLLQTAVATRKVKEGQVRRSDAELRAENARLKTQLQQVAKQMLARTSKRWNFRQPWCLSALVAAVLSGIYFFIYFSHLVVFFSERSSISKANRRLKVWEEKRPVPKFEDFKAKMHDEFFCGLRSLTVIRLFVVIALAVGVGSYLAQHGYFEPLKEKLVPFLYLGFVGILVLQVLIRSAWEQSFAVFGPLLHNLHAFTNAIQELVAGGGRMLSSIEGSFGEITGFG